jgi:two-component system, NtrC family, sensor kinase
MSQRASLSLVTGVATALQSGGIRAALDLLREEGIDATAPDGALELHTSVDPELEAALISLFALALDERTLLPAGRQAALGELTAEIAHEINNPLFAILGLVELVRNEAQPGTKPHDRLLLVEQTGLELKALVRALLTFAGESTDDTRPVSLHDVVTETIELVRHTSASKGVEIVERLGTTPIRVEGNRNQLKQLLLNVLTNARHVLPDGGTVTVTLSAESGWATVRVSDTGPGIAPGLNDRIFAPFFSTKGEHGTGLGLAVSRTIARLHGGSLTVDETRAGASFVVRLPILGERA